MPIERRCLQGVKVKDNVKTGNGEDLEKYQNAEGSRKRDSDSTLHLNF